MITAIVRFPLPEEIDLDKARTMYEASAPNYKSSQGLVRKYYLFSGDEHVGGGVYLWNSRDDADRQYSPDWRKMIAERFGAAPEITYYETPVIVDNA